MMWTARATYCPTLSPTPSGVMLNSRTTIETSSLLPRCFSGVASILGRKRGTGEGAAEIEGLPKCGGGRAAAFASRYGQACGATGRGNRVPVR